MDTRVLFLRTLDDLSKKLASRDPYEVLRSAFLLRQLLFDSTTINAVPPEVDEHTLFWALADGFDPDTSLRPPMPKQVKLAKLLAHPALYMKPRFLTVGEVLDHILYVDGAGHTPRDPQTEAEKLLSALQNILTIMGQQALIRLLPPIGRVVVKGLEPVRLAVARFPRRGLAQR
jgi:hypothetical protein